MQKEPIDYILEKVIAELLKREDISSVSQSCLNMMIDLIKNYICDIGRFACIEAIEVSRPTVSINEMMLGVMSKCSLYDLHRYVSQDKLPTIYGYIADFPNSAFQHTVVVPSSHLNTDLPSFFKPIPSPHISRSSSILSVERDQDKAMNRKRLLEERRMVKKSICSINDGNTILWETNDLQELRQQRAGEERLPTMPSVTYVTKNPSRLPEMLKKKPVTFETENGIGVDNCVVCWM